MVPGLGLALGGGAARGIAHIGVLWELDREGIKPAIITGTSSGAVVAALYAAGLTIAELISLSARVQWHHVTQVSFSRRGPIDLAPLARAVNDLVDGREFGQLTARLGVVAVDLLTGEEVLLASGDIGTAVQASCAIPGLFRPVRRDERTLVDGGLLQDVPARAARRLGAERVIAVDLHRFLAPVPHSHNVLRTTLRALEIIMQSRSRADASDADVEICPQVATCSPVDLRAVDSLIRAGRSATREAMPVINELVAEMGGG